MTNDIGLKLKIEIKLRYIREINTWLSIRNEFIERITISLII